MTNAIKLLGLDPGLRKTGWGIIISSGHRLSYVAHGVIESDEKMDLATRLQQLHEGLHQMILLHQPNEAAVEETFVNKNPASTLKLGMARGVVMLAPALHHIPVFEYAANRVKKAVVGTGHADKSQIETMIRHLLPTAGNVTKDAADALAVAICHAHHRVTQQKWENAHSLKGEEYI